MEQGLAAMASTVYGDGNSNTIKHFYAGSGKPKECKGDKMACGTKKKKGK